MKIIEEPLNGMVLFEPRVFGDVRGYFFESYKKSMLDADFVQDNESLSAKGILRGLHFQAPPYDQGKLVRVTQGAVLDVAVDIRKGSPSYGDHYKVILSAENKFILWIPPGFAHGFYTLRDESRFLYKCTNYYHKESEMGLMWNDPDLNINWNEEEVKLSEKDQIYPTFKNFNTPFSYV